MDRRNFLKCVSLSPFVGLLGFSKAAIKGGVSKADLDRVVQTSPIISQDMTQDEAFKAVDELKDFCDAEFEPHNLITWKCKCKGTGRLWSQTIKNDPECIRTPQQVLSVRSCDCKAGIERDKRLNV